MSHQQKSLPGLWQRPRAAREPRHVAGSAAFFPEDVRVQCGARSNGAELGPHALDLHPPLQKGRRLKNLPVGAVPDRDDFKLTPVQRQVLGQPAHNLLHVRSTPHGKAAFWLA
jgi:hypothetical protein